MNEEFLLVRLWATLRVIEFDYKMMHYRKGDNIEKEIQKSDLPFHDCMPQQTKDFLWMHVKGGTKVRNVVDYAKSALDKGEYRTIVWSGSGSGIVKTISCAEIIKRSHELYQVTRMCYTTIEEHWLPQMDGLEEIVVCRQVPCLHILMSRDAIDDTISGLQKPNTTSEFWTHSSAAMTRKRDSNGNSSGNRGSQRGDRRAGGNNNKNQRRQQKPNKQPTIPTDGNANDPPRPSKSQGKPKLSTLPVGTSSVQD